MLFKRKQIPFPIPDDARELTDAEMILVNGGAKIENSLEAQAKAQVGDTVTRKDGSSHTLTKGDIAWAQNQLGNGVDSVETTVVSETSCLPDSDVCSNSSCCISGSRCPPNSSGTSVPRITSSSPAATTNSAVSSDSKNNGYPDYVDTANGIVYADKRSRKGNLSEMLGNVSTNTGIANITADKIIDYSDDAVKFTKLAKYSKWASKGSSITGGIATGIDLKIVAENPTFENISTLTSHVVGFIPEVGPFASIGVSYASEKVEDAAQAGIQTASIGLQYEHRINSVLGNNSSVLLGDNMDSGYIVKSYCLQWLDWFFGKE